MNNPKILVVEDDSTVRNLITTTLKSNEYRFITAPTGEAAIVAATTQQPDILFLDLGLPDMDGIAIIKRIRSWSQMPIIVISARSEDADKVAALDAGADDYLTKPFSVTELLARLRVAQRRISAVASNSADSVFRNGGLTIDYGAGCVTLSGEEMKLTPTEYKLLCLLAKDAGKVLTHTYLTNKIWGSSWESDMASLRVHMATLRKKLEKDSQTQYIQTHIGIGYRMLKVE